MIRKPKILSRLICDCRLPYDILKSHLGQFATVGHITKAENLNQSVCDCRLPYNSQKSYLSQFATANYITKAENINHSVYRPRATLQKPGTSVNQFTDRRLLCKSLETSIRQIRICKTTIQQSEICNSILYILVPTTIYFLLYIYSFNSICSIYSILQDEL
jgi:hypothetical protein